MGRLQVSDYRSVDGGQRALRRHYLSSIHLSTFFSGLVLLKTTTKESLDYPLENGKCKTHTYQSRCDHVKAGPTSLEAVAICSLREGYVQEGRDNRCHYHS